MSQEGKKRILFLCTGNSCRSQMAEALVNHLRGDHYQALSAGVAPHGLDARAVKAMAELGLDISGNRSKDTSEFLDQEFDYIVTVCDNARENCPFFPGAAQRVHAGFPDPPYLAAGAKSEEEAMAHYRRVRDEIKAFVEAMPASLQRES
ncbi:MAG: arsenate reductase ArsC [Desulfarculaceae bacterium]|nr:arsenate reductase ArsC [Desulfarculaceae bacterium]MCF8071637.1 arsenate reductase ArsC [Desulfarculaceae bacterium]MCF8103166.1 arsenate reductase ArsC [Desulfarculaceae bacterium]MCF8114916.1 arsenate reductase ArsC [Desulfarculaceae bacterium]